jgi:hypothetical protein
MTKAKTPAKAPAPKDVVLKDGDPYTGPVKGHWTFVPYTGGFTGHKVFADGNVRDVHGADLDEAKANAFETDRVNDARIKGTREQNKVLADELRRQADEIENSV